MDDVTATDRDLAILTAQLGRPVRDVVEIPARCTCGNPLVAATAPRLANGTPFPTVFYLAHPVITAAVSRLEAAGLMYTMTDRIAEDEALAAAHRAAHEDYLAERARIGAAAGPFHELAAWAASCCTGPRAMRRRRSMCTGKPSSKVSSWCSGTARAI